MSDIKRGDRVRVAFEVEAKFYNGPIGIDHYAKGGRVESILKSAVDNLTVEKIEPPVEVFKPGDVVRHKRHGDVRAIGNDGWVNLTHGDVVTRVYDLDQRFTSDKYERVNVG